MRNRLLARNRGASDLVILDAASMEEQAVVDLPLAIPYGLHGDLCGIVRLVLQGQGPSARSFPQLGLAIPATCHSSGPRPPRARPPRSPAFPFGGGVAAGLKCGGAVQGLQPRNL